MDPVPTVVAIVDDDEAVRRALRRLVLSLSYSPIMFPSGEAFLARDRRAALHCVLMDQHMPSMNGIDVLRHMGTQAPRVPVIIVTGFDQAGLREKCLSAGAADYLVKPLEASAVAAAINSAIAA